MVSLSPQAAARSARPARRPVRPDRQGLGVLGVGLLLTLVALPMAGASFALLLASPLLLLAGFAIAVTAWLRRLPWDGHGVTRWDLAGLLVLLGFAAALLSDPVRSLP